MPPLKETVGPGLIIRLKAPTPMSPYPGENAQCPHCTRNTFANADQWHGHQKIHEKKVKCPKCTKRFATKKDLERHFHVRHVPVGDKHKCPSCSYETVRLDNLNRHRSTKGH